MTAMLDTSFLFALTDRDDRNHEKASDLAKRSRTNLVLPIAVLPEICYLLVSRLGHQAMRRFLASLAGTRFRLSV